MEDLQSRSVRPALLAFWGHKGRREQQYMEARKRRASRSLALEYWNCAHHSHCSLPALRSRAFETLALRRSSGGCERSRVRLEIEGRGPEHDGNEVHRALRMSKAISCSASWSTPAPNATHTRQAPLQIRGGNRPCTWLVLVVFQLAHSHFSYSRSFMRHYELRFALWYLGYSCGLYNCPCSVASVLFCSPCVEAAAPLGSKVQI